MVRRSTQASRVRSAYLTVIHGINEGAVFEVTVGVSIIGRDPRAEVRLLGDGVSRRHAKLVRDEDGVVKLVDLGSTNGTWIEGRRIEAEGLRDGDRIRVGPCTVLGFHHAHPATGTGPRRQASPLPPTG